MGAGVSDQAAACPSPQKYDSIAQDSFPLLTRPPASPDFPTMKPIIPIRKEPFDDPAYLFELKLDGFRGIADKIQGRMLSKNGNRLRRFERRLHRQWTTGGERLKGAPGGKTYVGPEGPPASPQDREVVSFDGRVLVLPWMDPEVASRYGTGVYMRSGARA